THFQQLVQALKHLGSFALVLETYTIRKIGHHSRPWWDSFGKRPKVTTHERASLIHTQVSSIDECSGYSPLGNVASKRLDLGTGKRLHRSTWWDILREARPLIHDEAPSRPHVKQRFKP